jgi:serine/threonine protein kinase
MKLASARTPGTEDTMTTGPVQAGPTTAAGNAPETLSGRRAIAPEPWAADDEPETELPVPVGELLGGKYSVEATFAEGGMGIVCLGRHVQLDQPVAIKFLRRALAGRPAIAQRFLNEARALAALRSEHVVRVMDVGQLDSGRPYLVMEHLDGMHLEALLDRHGALDVETAIGYVLQVCEPLAEAHALGIVHRDLKPENLFLWSGGPAKDTIKVLDFGLAKQLGSAALGVTGPQDSLGSPGYMSPEQITTPQLVDARSDIWSLGVVLYRLLTNTLPFGGDSLVEVLSHILNATPPPLAQLRPGLDAELHAIVIRCLEKAPAARYETMTEVAQALEGYLATRAQMTQSAESQIVTAPQPSSSISKRAEKIRIPGVHSRWPALLAVLVVLLATAVVVGDRSGRIRLRNLSDGWLTPARLAADSPARTQKPAELPQLALSKQGANAVPELERAAGANPFPNRDAEPTSAVPLSDEERARKEEAYREYLASQGLTPLREVEVEPAPEPAPEPR